jgi:hypothetical protein
MKTIVSAIIALGFLAGVANASPVAKIETQSVVEYGCGWGH